MIKKIFITGGAGFISSHLIESLAGKFEIVVYDNLQRNALKYLPFANNPGVTLIEGDVLDLPSMREAMKGADVCVHAAAIAGIYSVGKSASQTMKVNFFGTFNALEAAVQTGVRRFVDFSTSEVYGPFVYRGKETDTTTQGPVGEKRWIYAVSKLAGEHYAQAYGEEHGLEVNSVRPFNIYGPRQMGEGAIQQMVCRALNGEEITVYNDGTQIRSWCYVSDFVSALQEMIFREDIRGQVFNVGNPQATVTVLGLAEHILQMTESKSRIVFRPHPGPEVEMRVPDIGKARDLLSFDPKVGLMEGLEQSIAWFKENMNGAA
ncbi:MAG: NAD-dependent epimerase/dehydratase family protein [Candidatus Latescibacteria bacterium]|jgi:UDP-glucose 4-epimerase|nr:NAD-dependent epimerase/dehydratase family protein [Candidatus Latescibacterota bacterium]